MEEYITEAFKKLNLLEDDFNMTVDADKVDELKSFVEDDVDEVPEEPIIDLEAETEEDLEDTYNGKVILECECCHSRVYKDVRDVIIDQESELANVDEECPVCGCALGWTVIGKIEKFSPDELPTEKEDDSVDLRGAQAELETEDEVEEVDESLKENLTDYVDDDFSEEEVEEACKDLDECDLKESWVEEVWGQMDEDDPYGDDPYSFAAEYGLEVEELDRRDGMGYDETLYRFSGRKEDFDRAMRDGYFYSVQIGESDCSDDLKESLKEDFKEVEIKSVDDLKKYGDNFYAVKDPRYFNQIIKNGKLFKTENGFKYVSNNKKVKPQYFDNLGDYVKECFGEDLHEDLYDYQDSYSSTGELKIDKNNIKGMFIDIMDSDEFTPFDWLADYGSDAPALTKKCVRILRKLGYKRSTCPEDWPELLADNLKESELLDFIVSDITDGDKTVEDLIDNGDHYLIKESLKEGLTEDDDYDWSKAMVPQTNVTYTDLVDEIEQYGIDIVKGSKNLIIDYIKEFYDLPGFGANYIANVIIKNSRNILKMIHESLNEDFKEVEIKTDDQKLEMTSDENGKVTVTTEPLEEEEILPPDDIDVEAAPAEDAEEIVPLTDEEEAEIETNVEDETEEEQVEPDADLETGEGESEEEVTDVDEESVDEVAESFMKNIYHNVKSYKTTSAYEDGDKLVLEGLITFNSGATKKTSFKFNPELLSNKSVRLIGLNETFSNRDRSFNMRCHIENKKLIAESMRYNYVAKDKLNESVQIKGRSFRKK